MQDWNPYLHFRQMWSHRELILQLTKREISSRYKGSYLGILWTFVTPILMISIYTFVFSGVFKARWPAGSSSKMEFALIIFCGLIAFNIFSELISKAPGLILTNVNYVKKVVFPLEILPVVLLGSALIQGIISMFILIIVQLFVTGVINWTIILMPVVLLPIMLMSLGIGWFLSSLGVFLRDIGHIIGVGLTALMFLSPIFYPISSIPNGIKILYVLNPLTYVVEDLRRVMIWGNTPDWLSWFVSLFIGFIISFAGLVWFQKTKKTFADIL
ncbi:ABC transporter permease [Cohnella candidum]|uniref:Transport permease protein n=1 Tax=Cohnella candidum TaxID=2674991 RepID=A0A3G3K1X8_9BACL|nr:ABC transporter permease [Cohnella candidum]AYQ74171.1 ABC transporter permease [Cohnella candidum]